MEVALSEDINRELDRQYGSFVSEMTLYENYLYHKISKKMMKKIEGEVFEFSFSETEREAI